MKSNRKITILGAGNVGATIAYTLTLEGLCSEIVLIDIDKEKAMGEAMDIRQGLNFTRSVNIYSGEYSDAAGSDIVIITSGVARRPGQTRIDLAQTNMDILKTILGELGKYASNAVFVVVSNPVDILTYAAVKYLDVPASRVIGSGTLLDSSRLRSIIAERIDLTPQNIHAYVLGEHGDTSVIPWSLTAVSGMPIDKYCENVHEKYDFSSSEGRKGIEKEVRTSGATVISYKKGTYYAIAMSVKYLCETILRGTNSILTVSGMLTGQYGIEDVCLSLPFIVGSKGIKKPVVPPLTDYETVQLMNSAKKMKDTLSTLKL